MSQTTSALGGRAYLRLVALGALIGVPAALVAVLLLAVVHGLEHWLWHSLPSALGHSSPPWYLVVGLPVAGACIVLAARLLLPGDGGRSPLGGLESEPTPIVFGPGIALAGIGTLAFGGVLGPEGPLIALGSVVGLTAAAVGRITGREAHVLGTAGSFSAISAVFGGPIVGGTMLVEAGIGLGTALMPVLLPGFVAAAIGYVIFIGFGNWGGLAAPGLTVPQLPPYNGTHLIDLLVAVAVGIVTPFVIIAVRRGATALAGPGLGSLGLPALLLGGGLALGLVALLADALGADSQDVLFSGQAAVPSLVATESTKIVLILLVAKALGYAISLGCGFRGGPVFPAVFLGIAVATLAERWFGVSPTLVIAAGAAAGMAAATKLLLTASLFAALLVGSADLDAVPAAVLGAAAAWLTMTALEDRAKSVPTPAA